VNILLLNYEFPPIGGGAGIATFCLAEALAGFGHNVDILTSGGLGDRPIEKCRGFTIYRAISLGKIGTLVKD
jgi:hypothetical protein